jgi:hypothetical protein
METPCKRIRCFTRDIKVTEDIVNYKPPLHSLTNKGSWISPADVEKTEKYGAEKKQP